MASLATDLTGTLTNGIPGSLSETAGQKIVTAAAVKALVDAESAADSTTISGSSSNGVVPTSKNVYDFVNGNYQAKAATGDTMYVGHNGTWRALESATTDSQAATDYVTLKWDATNNVYQVNLDSGHIAATSALTGSATNDSGLVTAGSIRSTILQAVESSIDSNSTDDSTVPSTKNVYDFVTGYASGNYQPKVGVASSFDSAANGGEGASKVMVGYTTRSGSGTDQSPYVYSSEWRQLRGETYIVVADDAEYGPSVRINTGMIAGDGNTITGTSSSASTKDDLTTAWAVKEYVTTQLGGLAIPEPSVECKGTNLDSDADGACALVMAWDSTANSNQGAVTLKWRKMAQ